MLLEPLHGEHAQVIAHRGAGRRRKIRQPRLAQRELEGAAARDLHGILERLGKVGEELRHFRLRLEVLRGPELARAPRIAQHPALRDADARLVRGELLGGEELHRVRGDHRQSEPPGERDRGTHVGFVALGIGALQFDVVGAGEIRRPFARKLLGLRGRARQQRRAHIARFRT